MSIDWVALWRLADHKRRSTHQSFRELSRQLGLVTSGSCFTRMKAGKAVDAEAFVKILDWLKISHRSITRGPSRD